MIGAGAFRGKQQKDQIDGLVVQSFEIDGRVQASKNTNDGLDIRKLAMRDRDPVSDACRTETLALQNDIEYFPFRQAGQLGSLGCEFLEQLLFGICLQTGDN